MLEIKAVITEEQIAPLAALIGSVPLVALPDPAGSNVFLGFAGAIDVKDLLYKGVMRFDVPQGNEPSADLSLVASVLSGKAAPAAPSKSSKSAAAPSAPPEN